MKERDYKYIPEALILSLIVKDVVESKPSGLLKVICNFKDKPVWVTPSIADYISQYLGKEMEYACVIHLTGIFIIDILDKSCSVSPKRTNK